MKSNVFQDAVESSAKVIGRKDVRVVFEGDQAHTDGNLVVLPSLPVSAEITVNQAEVVRGYRDHESMHVRCTNTSKESLNQLGEMTTRSADLGAIVQYCEDVRIEHAGIQEYAGMKRTLSATNTAGAKAVVERMEGMGGVEFVLKNSSKAIQFRTVLQYVGRNEIGVTSDGVFDKLCDMIKAIDPKLHALATKYGKLMAQLPTGYKNNKLNEAASRKGTAKAFDLAEEIHKAFCDHVQQNPQPQPQPQPPGPAGDPYPDGDPGQSQKPNDDSSNGSGKQQGSDDKGDDDSGDDGITDTNKPSGRSGKSKGSDDDDGEDDSDAAGNGDGGDDDGDKDDSEGGDAGSGDADSDSDSDSDSDGDDSSDDGDTGASDQTKDDAESDDDANGGGDDAGSGQQNDGASDDGKSGSQVPGGGHGNSMGTIPDCGLDDVYKQGLNKTIQDITQGPDIGKGKVLNKGLFQVFSNRFSTRCPIENVSYSAHSAERNDRKKNGLVYSAQVRMNNVEASITGKRAMIRRILELELQARNDRHWEGGHTSGRLQSVRLVDAVQGRERVYQKRDGGKEMDTLLYISIDGSGSMTRDDRATQSVALAYALSEALERTGCDIIVEMWGDCVAPEDFRSYTHNDVERAWEAVNDEIRQAKNSSNVPYASLGILTRGIIKEKRQRTSDPIVRKGFGLATFSIASCTPTFHAVFTDLRDMGKENHAKKIYLHITDGDPDGTINGLNGKDIMKEAHAYASTIGVHMIGVGIGGMRVSHLFQDYVEVNGADAYEPVVRKLAKLIAKEAGHAAQFKRVA